MVLRMLSSYIEVLISIDSTPHTIATTTGRIPFHNLYITPLPLLQVQLQNMMTSKFVGYFIEQVSDWQKKLATADSVITIWFEVQLTWSHLESIFIGSEDIRAQLPEHSKQFDTIDADFKVRTAQKQLQL